MVCERSRTGSFDPGLLSVMILGFPHPQVLYVIGNTAYSRHSEALTSQDYVSTYEKWSGSGSISVLKTSFHLQNQWYYNSPRLFLLSYYFLPRTIPWVLSKGILGCWSHDQLPKMVKMKVVAIHCSFLNLVELCSEMLPLWRFESAVCCFFFGIFLHENNTSVTHCWLTISLANSRYITWLIVVVYIYFLYIFAHRKPQNLTYSIFLTHGPWNVTQKL